MAGDQTEVSFDGPCRPRDPWGATLFAAYRLGAEASMVAIEPIFAALWTNPKQRLEAFELALGRRIDSRELRVGGQLAELGLAMSEIEDPSQAFDAVLVEAEIASLNLQTGKASL